MFQAVVVLQSIDRHALSQLLQKLADELDLVARGESPDTDASSRTQVWARRTDEGSIREMRMTFDTDMECNYLAFRGDTHEGVTRAVGLAYAELPVQMPQPLAQQAIAHWRSRPGLLPCAALVATDETAAPLAQAIFLALAEDDDAVWKAAASAAALMPATESHWLIGTALATQQDAERRQTLERLMDFLGKDRARAR